MAIDHLKPFKNEEEKIIRLLMRKRKERLLENMHSLSICIAFGGALET